jgi:two-component system, OmpR family, sensor histidine kinase PhoQ
LKSLRARLLITLGSLLLLAVIVALGALDWQFQQVSQSARREVLEALNVAVLGVVDEDPEGRLRPPGPLADPRLDTPRSGLYAMVRPRADAPTWRSGSLTGADVALDLDAAPGQKRLATVPQADGRRLLVFAQGVAWQGADGRQRDYVFIAAEDQAPYEAQLRALRGKFLVGGALMLVLAALVVAGAAGVLLQPLRRIERQIAEVEVGERARLEGDWPRELRGVAGNLNALLAAERERSERYRTTLGNLAHSLKTPLSVLRTLLAQPVPVRDELGQQVDRMQDIVQHQLRRATTGSLAPGVAWTPVLPVVQDVVGALAKVYAERGLRVEVAGEGESAPDAALSYPMDRGDLLELVGNLADNACKWAATRVVVRLEPWPEAGWRRPGLVLCVDDDGPGIAPEARARVLERGVRLDERVPGQGIGLSMVADIVAAHSGDITVDTSTLGGARFRLRLPGR